jgi:hypothetical protein
MKLPRNIIENDPSWFSLPSEDGYTMKWINKGLELMAQCNSHDNFCLVFSTSMNRHSPSDLSEYRNLLTSGDRPTQEITKYLSSIYLNPNPYDLRLKPRNNRRNDPFRLI